MNDDKGNGILVRRIKDELDAGLDQMDPAIIARLNESRRNALVQPAPSFFSGLRSLRLLPLTGIATAAILMVAVSLWYTMRPTVPENRVEDMEVLTAQGNLDMYRDLDFYKWLANSHETR